MYYHIIIKPKSDEYYGEYKTDLTREQLISRYISLYESGEPIVINGKTIESSDIERVTITESDVTIESFVAKVKYENENSSVLMIGGPSYTYQAISYGRDVTDDYIDGPPGSKRIGRKENLMKQDSAKNKVFIVHSHDQAAQSKVARFVEKMGFEAIILHEKASSGRTVIEKIEHYSEVGYAIVLYTPDDIGNVRGKEDSLKLRARQNVIFEHGFLIAKLGRENVAAIVEGDIELPNDISGVVYIKLDEAAAWQLQLAKEMKQSGYEIDMNKLI